MSYVVLLIPSDWEHCPACVLTSAFPSYLSCCRRHCQLIQTSIPDSWLQILLVPLTCWISSEAVFALLQNNLFCKMFWQHSLLHAVRHLAQCDCKILTFPHPVVPPFTFPTICSIVALVSNSSVFFWMYSFQKHCIEACASGNTVHWRKRSLLHTCKILSCVFQLILFSFISGEYNFSALTLLFSYDKVVPVLN